MITIPTATERIVDVDGVRVRLFEAGPADAPLVILAHGFPELAYSWRYQIPALANAGYHVLAPDQRGYGGTTQPASVEAYDIAALTGDLVGLIDFAGATRAAVVGHDLGAVVAWGTALLHPDRVAAVAGLSVPPVPRPRTPPTEAFRRIFGEHFFYILYFQETGQADTELAADPRRTMRRMLAGMRAPANGTPNADDAVRMLQPGPAGFIERLPEPEGLPAWLSSDDLDIYVEEFTRTGFTGALNWYRNFDRNWHVLGASPVTGTITVPALFVGGRQDPVLNFTSMDRAHEVAKGLYRQVMLDGAGHWIQQERPQDVNAELLAFLSQLNWS